ncbi:hypothetical protein [Cytobacillus purgationiresistens]|uniref:Uncharacterized protein n=1 Tax=Cytobacillus purgationiresistens TaxID=863449 RepID=A0ABU0AIX2_9BACI|nr:hypothetical protein [Cytobacillus purgationiresistens]MDQ0271212.1 hypothetical protein [Cytobacillus purgationiresistens]
MKKILFLGNKDKSDLVLYTALIMEKSGYKPLIVDTSFDNKYFHAYAECDDKQTYYDFFGVDIAAASSPKLLESVTGKSENELNDYDFILVDIESTASISKWSGFEHRYYIGNQKKVTLKRDSALLMQFIEKYPDEKEFQKVLFSVYPDLDEDYLDELIKYKVKWIPDTYDIPYDEFNIVNKINMQFNMKPMFKKVSTDYKNVLAAIYTDLTGHHEKDMKHALNQLKRSK